MFNFIQTCKKHKITYSYMIFNFLIHEEIIVMKNILYALALLATTCISANTEFKHTPFTPSAVPLVVKMQAEYYMIAEALLKATITPEIQKLPPRTAKKILNGLRSDDINKRKNAARLLAENNCSLEKLHSITSQVTIKKNPDDFLTLSEQYGKMDTIEQETLRSNLDALNTDFHANRILKPLFAALEKRISETADKKSLVIRKVVLYGAATGLTAGAVFKYRGHASSFFKKIRSFVK